MKKQKMLITLAGLVVAVATTATVAAYTLAGDGSPTPAVESGGTQEPAFQDDKLPTFDPAPNTIYDGKGNVSVTNPDVKVDDTPPLHGDPPPPVGRPQQETVDGNADPTPKDDVDDVGTEVVRVTPALADLEDNLLATGAEVKVSGEVVKQPFFSVDSRIIEVNG